MADKSLYQLLSSVVHLHYGTCTLFCKSKYPNAACFAVRSAFFWQLLLYGPTWHLKLPVTTDHLLSSGCRHQSSFLTPPGTTWYGHFGIKIQIQNVGLFHRVYHKIKHLFVILLTPMARKSTVRLWKYKSKQVIQGMNVKLTWRQFSGALGMSPMDLEGYITPKKNAGMTLALSWNVLHHNSLWRQEENMLPFAHII